MNSTVIEALALDCVAAHRKGLLDNSDSPYDDYHSPKTTSHLRTWVWKR